MVLFLFKLSNRIFIQFIYVCIGLYIGCTWKIMICFMIIYVHLYMYRTIWSFILKVWICFDLRKQNWWIIKKLFFKIWFLLYFWCKIVFFIIYIFLKSKKYFISVFCENYMIMFFSQIRIFWHKDFEEWTYKNKKLEFKKISCFRIRP